MRNALLTADWHKETYSEQSQLEQFDSTISRRFVLIAMGVCGPANAGNILLNGGLDTVGRMAVRFPEAAPARHNHGPNSRLYPVAPSAANCLPAPIRWAAAK